MRAIHLCFEITPPLPANEFGDFQHVSVREAFERANKAFYQPLFALMERNIQKHKRLKFSLMIPGIWFDLAAQYDRDLIARLQKIVKLERAELIVEPYYHSLPFFAEPLELSAQVKMQQEKLKQLFGEKGKILALPEFTYNNEIGKWAGDAGFAGMLIGSSIAALDWHSPNHVYEAPECKYLRLLVNNRQLTNDLEQGSKELLVEQPAKDDISAKTVFSVEKFLKKVGIETLRGSLLNLFLNAQIFQTQSEHSITSFFDKLFETWLDKPGQHFVTAMEACTVERPKLMLSLPTTVCKLDLEAGASDGETGDGGGTGGDGETNGGTAKVAILAKTGGDLPDFLSNAATKRLYRKIYDTRRAVVATGDEELLADFRKLTPIEYLVGVIFDDHGDKAEPVTAAELEAKLAELQKRSDEIKKVQAVEISKTYTKRRDRGLDTEPATDADTVAVKIGRKSSDDAGKAVVAEDKQSDMVGLENEQRDMVGPENEQSNIVAPATNDGEVKINFGKKSKATEAGDAEAEGTGAGGQDQDQNGSSDEVIVHRTSPKPAKKRGGVRRVIRKLVIE